MDIGKSGLQDICDLLQERMSSVQENPNTERKDKEELRKQLDAICKLSESFKSKLSVSQNEE